MQSLGKPFERAYQFRNKTKAEFAWRVLKRWEEVQPEVEPFNEELGFMPIDLAQVDVADLCRKCKIDHAIGPVPHTRGGSVAGYERWELFKSKGLKDYARLRNDAAISFPQGVSRLSPYIHHGHVSVFRIVREAAAEKFKGAEKFLDELLIWRELAHNFCFYRQEIETLEAIPLWAQKTLEEHINDKREALYSWERLARGETGDPLWDAAQKSLLIHGELHNNVRMTWGKALLRWTQHPEDALRLLIDLNHRYALDGNDPNSYGGLFWCLGLFDRPFKPERPIIGTLRPRPTSDNARRINFDKYKAKTIAPARSDQLSVAVVGAGISGLMTARTLMDHGLEVRVFDKARGPGGRCSTRRERGLSFDHGAQYFTVRDDRFKRYVDAWIDEGLVQSWQGRVGTAAGGKVQMKGNGTDRFVGVPGMSAVAGHLASQLDISFDTRVRGIEGTPNCWRLIKDSGEDLGSFSVAIVAVPPEQAAFVLMESTNLMKQVQSMKMLPTWAVMAVFNRSLDLELDGMFVKNSPLSWVARNNSKPGRSQHECWVLHGSNEWSDIHLDDKEEEISAALLQAFFEAIGSRPIQPIFVKAHRWRYALAENPLKIGCLWDAKLRLGACGDWCQRSRIEGAFLSGMAMAGRVLGLPESQSGIEV
jgi:predicted NAD/FAD-dependent oxidoreductase